MKPRSKIGPDPKKADAGGKMRPGGQASRRRGGDFDRKTDPDVPAPIGVVAPDGTCRIEVWRTDRLQQHDMQDSNFHPLPDAELAALADDMRRNGQRTPIEVAPDRRVIDGHQRKRAAEMLGWDEVRVLVRYDLAGDEAAIERRMIEANLNRRQLDTLDRVRLARRMLEIKEKRKPGGLSQYAEQDLRDRVGTALGMSGRNVQRYLNILNAPMEVQRAYSEKKLSMKQAEKVARLEAAVQQEIASEIRAGGDPAAMVAAHLPEPAPAEVDPDREDQRFLEAATHAVAVLDGRVERVRGGWDLDSEIVRLNEAGALIDRLIARRRALKKQRAKTLREFDDMNIFKDFQ